VIFTNTIIVQKIATLPTKSTLINPRSVLVQNAEFDDDVLCVSMGVERFDAVGCAVDSPPELEVFVDSTDSIFVGFAEGVRDGAGVGSTQGESELEPFVGRTDGFLVGVAEGVSDGPGVGSTVGVPDGSTIGFTVGLKVLGSKEGSKEGINVGPVVGKRDGDDDGANDGMRVGSAVVGSTDDVRVGVAELGARVGNTDGIVDGFAEGVSDGTGDGAEVGAAYGAGALEANEHPLPVHSNDDAALAAMSNDSQLPESHVTEHGPLRAHSISVLPEHALPPVHTTETVEAPLPTKIESVHACSPEQRSVQGCDARQVSVWPPLQ